MSSSRGSSQPRYPALAGRFFITSATWEAWLRAESSKGKEKNLKIYILSSTGYCYLLWILLSTGVYIKKKKIYIYPLVN